jgi:hypothetical protein
MLGQQLRCATTNRLEETVVRRADLVLPMAVVRSAYILGIPDDPVTKYRRESLVQRLIALVSARCPSGCPAD